MFVPDNQRSYSDYFSTRDCPPEITVLVTKYKIMESHKVKNSTTSNHSKMTISMK